ncbi:MAG: riboflavin synthase [Planctomycetales bacterium]|nr:riboflavin synthase [Planctomycetales bacterium]
MFSGLVEATAQVVRVQNEAAGIRLSLERPPSFVDAKLGDSIAINGCCLTIVSIDDLLMVFQAGEETLSKTNLSSFSSGSKVNCERSLAFGDRLGGHLVTGHVDGQATLVSRQDNADWSTMWFEVPKPLIVQIAPKGSVAVEGVSLTVVAVIDQRFSVALIPHTLQHTTLGALALQDRVNLETDLLAKYVQRQLNSGYQGFQQHIPNDLLSGENELMVPAGPAVDAPDRTKQPTEAKND